jgi:hypothetical protein
VAKSKELDGSGKLIEEHVGWELTAKERKAFAENYMTARAGDHLMTAFQCELCHFRNCFHRNPRPENKQDWWTLQCMIRANVDAFWSKRASTVQGNLGEVRRFIKLSHRFGIEMPLMTFPRGPFPLLDSFGMIPAIATLQRSFDRGRNSSTIQWETMRNLRTCFSNLIHTTPFGSGGATMTNGKKTSFVTNSPTNSQWFQRFMIGTHERMGDVKIQDTALSIDVLLSLQEVLEQHWIEAWNEQDFELLFELATIGCTATSGFSAGLRGEEIGHVRLHESVILSARGLTHPRKSHILLSLEGRFKGQISRKKHKIPLIPVSASGIQNQRWFLRLVAEHERQGNTMGPIFRKNPQAEEGAQIKHLDVLFHKYLLVVQADRSDLIPETVDVLNDYSIRRSLRRGSTTQARNQKVPRDVINLNNRWRAEDLAGARAAATGDMLENYTDVVAAVESLLQYSEPL